MVLILVMSPIEKIFIESANNYKNLLVEDYYFLIFTNDIISF